jgi:hypothetical protein
MFAHDQLIPGSDMQRGIEEGWPRVLSSLKSPRDREAASDLGEGHALARVS